MRKIKLIKEDILAYTSPLVYVFIKNDIIIYVGKSKRGIHRTFDPYHQASEARELADEICLYICSNEKEAISLEIELIKEYKPKYNKEFNLGHMNLYQNEIIKENEEISKEVPKWKQVEALRIVKDLLKE